MGVVGMGIFRRTVQIEQAKNDFLSSLREAQNLSRNSVSSTVKGTDIISGKVDGYAIFFDVNKNNYSLRYCVKTSFVGKEQYDCSGVERTSAKLINAPEVAIAPVNPAKCKGILFPRIDVNISALTADIASPDNTGSCLIKMTHTQGNEVRQISIDLAQNNITVL